jgi:uncharacterized protein DUF3617
MKGVNMKQALSGSLLGIFASLMICGPVTAADHPEMKEGLWQIDNKSADGSGSFSDQACRNHAFDKQVEAKTKTMMGKNCSKWEENYAEGKLTSDMVCKIGGSVVESKGVVTFQGDTATHTESHTTYTPPLYGQSETSETQDQKWLGPCPAGMQPGDHKGKDGTIRHGAQPAS